ncbi:hypothetical protein L2E82_21033 [Cichorium intybus]|uniref:Uncharacterized protein n=1 Tax=Cichorium intybus TaxID=13427 RepID=A0ACB9DUM9_CICIN|nr:hypothetical protein L2E82_21033 [Cichorium intybus]
MIKPASLLFMFLLLTSNRFQSHPVMTQARPLSIITPQRYPRGFDTLGMICKCCDLPKNECTSRWNGSCSHIQCSPWRSH